MKCEYCEHEFNIYSFAYRSIRKCPQCGQMYDMKFPLGTSIVPVMAAILLGVYIIMESNYGISVGVSVFILTYYILDIIIKIVLISMEKYTIVEIEK